MIKINKYIYNNNNNNKKKNKKLYQVIIYKIIESMII